MRTFEFDAEAAINFFKQTRRVQMFHFGTITKNYEFDLRKVEEQCLLNDIQFE